MTKLFTLKFNIIPINGSSFIVITTYLAIVDLAIIGEPD